MPGTGDAKHAGGVFRTRRVYVEPVLPAELMEETGDRTPQFRRQRLRQRPVNVKPPAGEDNECSLEARCDLKVPHGGKGFLPVTVLAVGLARINVRPEGFDLVDIGLLAPGKDILEGSQSEVAVVSRSNGRGTMLHDREQRAARFLIWILALVLAQAKREINGSSPEKIGSG